MTSKGDRVHLLCYFKLCASFRIHPWIKTGVTVQKRAFGVQIVDFSACMALNFCRWPWKTVRHIFHTTSSFMQNSIAIYKLKLELRSGIPQIGGGFFTSVTLIFHIWPWPFAWTSLLSVVITPGNYMTVQWWEHNEKGVADRQIFRRTDRQSDKQTNQTIHRATWPQLKLLHSSYCTWIDL